VQIGKELEKLEENIGLETKALTDIKVEKQNIRNKITELRNPRVLAELNAFEEKRKQLDQEKTRIEAEQKGIEVQLTDILGRDKENMQKLLGDMQKEEEAFTGEIADLEKMTAGQEAEVSKKEAEQAQFFSQFKGLIEKRNKLDKEITEKENKILSIDENGRKEEVSINTLSIEEARIKAETAGITAEFEQYSGVELDMKKPEEQLKKEINEFEKMMANIGNVNMRALEIYETVEKEYGVLLEKKNVLLKEKDDVVNMMNEIEANKKSLFVKTLEVVDGQFRRIFSQLTTKGEAYLELENREEPFAEGLRINVKITGNKFLDIRSLSGGEKTLTALAFLFAIQEHEPASFYVLDEVDAALDKHNSEKLARLIRSYCQKAQYIVISHNDAIISEGDILYGVSMNTEAGLSNVVSLKM
jgi:chromosome segregation protein